MILGILAGLIFGVVCFIVNMKEEKDEEVF